MIRTMEVREREREREKERRESRYFQWMSIRSDELFLTDPTVQVLCRYCSPEHGSGSRARNYVLWFRILDNRNVQKAGMRVSSNKVPERVEHPET
jgi:hypothetical protein